MENVEGTSNDHDVKIFTLSTCGWCNKTKKLLNSLDIEYKYADIDQLSGEEKEQAKKELKKHNSRMNTPTIVIDDGNTVIVGFKKGKIEEELKD